MMSLSLEIVARTLFHTEVTDDIRRINDEVNSIMEIYNFLVAFPRLEAALDLPFPLPIQRINDFRRSRARLDEVVNRLIAEHRASGEDRGDLLSMLIASRDEDGSALTDAQIRDEVLTIFLAGYETTANALTWTFYLLSQNPEAEAKLHAELDAVLGVSGISAANELSFRARQSRAEEPPHFAMPAQPPRSQSPLFPEVSSRPEARRAEVEGPASLSAEPPHPTAAPHSPTTPRSATPSRSSPNPCASTHRPGRWDACPPSPSPSGPTASRPAHTFS
jgi:hypothetical protein